MIRVNKSKQELENDIRVRRDALQTLHQRLKRSSDNFQLWIMAISTLSGSIEVTKLRPHQYFYGISYYRDSIVYAF